MCVCVSIYRVMDVIIIVNVCEILLIKLQNKIQYKLICTIKYRYNKCPCSVDDVKSGIMYNVSVAQSVSAFGC